MEYHEAIGPSSTSDGNPPTVGVESTRRLLAHLGRPDEDFRVV